MLAYYRFSGFIADLAVLLNILLVVALMVSLKAAFTLAGLAGLVLSVGMAVDANVLIYERMREETERGAGVRTAIRNGFARAFSTIVDSNLTTLISAFVLFAMGTDQLKGFAVTLILGLVLNLFTAVFCSRVAFDLSERNGWLRRLSMAKVFGNTNFEFVRWVRPAIIGSLAFILLGLAAAAQRGQGLFDIDFTGGTSVQVALKPDQALDVAEVRKAVAVLPNVAVSAVSGADIAADTRYKIDTSVRNDDQVEKTLRDVFPGRLATYSMGWTIERMPAVDRAALRIGTFEIVWADDVPDGVAIAEAVELVANLSTDESPSFVNGLLARIVEIKPTVV
jgi:SecD/SecF fusion protein